MKTRKKQSGPSTAVEPLSRVRNLVTWGLAGIWLLLVAFGGISMIDPPWLQKLSQPGIEVEAKSYKDYGDTFVRQGRYREAISQYARALEIRPDYPAALVNMAITYGRADNLAGGIALLQKALAKETVRPGTICFNIAQILEEQGQGEEAARYYRQALGTEVEESRIHRKLGESQLESGELAAARSSFELALAGQQDPTVHYRQMLYMALQSLDDDPENRQAIEDELARGLDAEVLAARYDLALIRRIQAWDRELAKTHNYLGVIYGRLGALDQAIDQFQASARIWPGNETAAQNLPLLERMKAERSAAGSPR